MRLAPMRATYCQSATVRGGFCITPCRRAELPGNDSGVHLFIRYHEIFNGGVEKMPIIGSCATVGVNVYINSRFQN